MVRVTRPGAGRPSKRPIAEEDAVAPPSRGGGPGIFDFLLAPLQFIVRLVPLLIFLPYAILIFFTQCVVYSVSGVWEDVSSARARMPRVVGFVTFICVMTLVAFGVLVPPRESQVARPTNVGPGGEMALVPMLRGAPDDASEQKVAPGAAPADAPPAAAAAPAIDPAWASFCKKWPFTSVDKPSNPDLAGCTYEGKKSAFLKRYSSASGNEYSNSDDVVGAFVSDCAQWSSGGKTGYGASMAQGKQILVIDIGANVGSFTRMLMSSYGLNPGVPKLFGQIHSFEPYPPTFEQLRKNIPENAPVYLHKIALTDAPTVDKMGGEAEFFGAYVRAANAETYRVRESKSYAPPPLPGDAPREQLDQNPAPTGASVGRTEAVQVSVGKVPLSTFDDYMETKLLPGPLKGVDFVVPLFKIDTEGMDLAVLRGAKRFLVKHRPQAVSIEWGAKWALVDPTYTLQEALAFMESLGYEAFHSGNAFQGVFHWLPLSCGLFDSAYDRTLDNKFNHYASTNIFFVRSDLPWLERFRKVHTMWEDNACKPKDWQSRVMP